MNTIDVRALLDAPHWPHDRALDTILGSLMKRRDLPLPESPPDPVTLWPPFAQVSADVVARCANDRLSEALMVEKLGLASCAKMTLLATSEEERMLYSMIASDEAMHFYWLSHFISQPLPPSPFLSLLAEIIENGTQTMLTMIVQVVLEGWGVEHYRSLAHDCANRELREVLRQIVIDEVRHHESGTRLLARREVTIPERDAIVAILARLLAMVQCGPQSVVAAIAPRTRAEAVQWFEGLDAENDSRRKLLLLRTLIAEANVEGVVEALDARGAFAPMTAEECADLCSIS